jgi:hypothetical protein
MICGLFGIMYVGGVYCPLNPTDPLVVGGTLVLLRPNGHRYALFCSNSGASTGNNIDRIDQKSISNMEEKVHSLWCLI